MIELPDRLAVKYEGEGGIRSDFGPDTIGEYEVNIHRDSCDIAIHALSVWYSRTRSTAVRTFECKVHCPLRIRVFWMMCRIVP